MTTFPPVPFPGPRDGRNPRNVDRGIGQRRRILELLTGHPATLAEICAHLGVGPSTARRHVERLVGCGAVVKEAGKYRAAVDRAGYKR